MVQEEVAQGLAEDRVELQTRGVLHHPDNETLEVPDDHLHAEEDSVGNDDPLRDQRADLDRDDPSQGEVQHQGEEAHVGGGQDLAQPPAEAVHCEAVRADGLERLQLVHCHHSWEVCVLFFI